MKFLAWDGIKSSSTAHFQKKRNFSLSFIIFPLVNIVVSCTCISMFLIRHVYLRSETSLEFCAALLMVFSILNSIPILRNHDYSSQLYFATEVGHSDIVTSQPS